jgi:methyl-accepting chemotaxis protein
MLANLKLRTLLTLGNSIILGLMVIVTAIVYTNVNSLIQTFGWVDHTHEVIADAEEVLASAVNMETGMRGYLLAGKEGFLAPYENGRKQFEEGVSELSNVVSDNPAQVKLLSEIKENIDGWVINVTEPNIDLRRKIGDAKTMNDMAAEIKQAKGKKYFDKFRGQIEIFIAKEEALLKRRQKQAANSTDINQLKELTERVVYTYNVIAEAKEILTAAVDMESGMRGFLLAGQESYLDPYNSGKLSFYAKIENLSKMVSDNKPQIRLLTSIEETITEWIVNVVEEQIALRREIGDAKTMDDMADLIAKAEGKVYFDKFREQITTFTERERSLMTQRQQDASDTAAMTKSFAVIGTFIAVLLGIGIVFFLIRLVMRQLGGEPAYIAEIAGNVAEGDLSMQLQSEGKDVGIFAAMKNMMETLSEKAELANIISEGDLTHDVHLASNKDALGRALQTMSGNLNRIIGEVSSATEQISSGAGQVSDTSQSLSQGATEQAASLQEISSSVNMMLSQTKANAENSRQASQLAEEAKDTAEKGNGQMKNMISAMNDINDSAQSISKIIKVIDEIAFQTNLLALNAAVEAARAGQHGKGFAVVAEEVRNLAARSATAAQETAELIEGSVQKTENGTTIAGNTADSLAEIVSAVTKVTDLIGEIAAASNEQSDGINQVNIGLSQIDQVTQQNTASAEEGAAAAEELSSQSAHLKSLMENFTIKGAMPVEGRVTAPAAQISLNY